jgi:hypothetical protein
MKKGGRKIALLSFVRPEIEIEISGLDVGDLGWGLFDLTEAIRVGIDVSRPGRMPRMSYPLGSASA